MVDQLGDAWGHLASRMRGGAVIELGGPDLRPVMGAKAMEESFNMTTQTAAPIPLETTAALLGSTPRLCGRCMARYKKAPDFFRILDALSGYTLTADPGSRFAAD